MRLYICFPLRLSPLSIFFRISTLYEYVLSSFKKYRYMLVFCTLFSGDTEFCYLFVSLLFQSSFFKRDDQALHGFAKYFKEQSEEEREHGIKFMDYQAERGGKVVFQDIAKPTTMEWGSPLQAMEAVLELEKTVRDLFITQTGVDFGS